MPTDTPPTESSGRKRRLSGGPLVAVVLFLLPILYVLSLGPVARMVANGSLKSVPMVYRQIMVISRTNPMCERAIERYANLWLPPGSHYMNGEIVWFYPRLIWDRPTMDGSLP